MVSTLYFVADRSFFEMKKADSSWSLKENPFDKKFMCLAVDPVQEGRLYAGTFDHGLWMSNNGGEDWFPAGPGITHNRVMSVAVSSKEVKNGYSVVWAGTEPSGLYRSEDGGKTWSTYPKLLDLESRSTWRFPPRPHTHHIQSIQPDIHNENRIFTGIELGGVMKSEDKGEHWEDRKSNSQFDCHALTMNRRAKGRIYEAAGGGYAESMDGGKTWETINDGLDPYTYLVDIAVDPADPDTIVASAAKGAHTAYNHANAETVMVRRKLNRPWQIVSEGLPERDGATIFSLLSHESEPGVFYAVNNLGLFKSSDAGVNWNRLQVEWPERLKSMRVRGFVAS